MTPENFRKIFTEQYLVHYPDLRAWCLGLDEQTREAWSALFTDFAEYDLEEAIQYTVSRAPIAAYDKDRTASILAGRTREISDKRKDEQRRRENLDYIKGLAVNKGREEGQLVGSMSAAVKYLNHLKAVHGREKALQMWNLEEFDRAFQAGEIDVSQLPDAPLLKTP